MNPDKLRYFNILSTFLINFTLLCSSLQASRIQEEDEENRGKTSINSSVVSILSKADNRLSTIQENLSLVNRDFDDFVKDQKKVEMISNGFRETTVKLKKTTDNVLEDFSKVNSSISKIQTQITNENELEKWLKTRFPAMEGESIKDAIHKNSINKPTFVSPYSGTTNYTGNVICEAWICNYCDPHVKNLWLNKEDRCRGCGYKYNPSKDNNDDDLKITLSGKASVNYNGSHAVTCQEGHHNCKCEDWSTLISNFQKVLAQQALYKTAHERTSTQLKELKDHSEIIDQNTNGIMMVSQSSILGLKIHSDKLMNTAKVFNLLASEREISKNEVLHLVTTHEAELKSELSNKGKEIKKVREDLENKHEEIKNVYKETADTKIDLKEELYKHTLSHITEKKDFEGQYKLVDTKIRSLLPRMLPKLLTMANIKGEEQKPYINKLKNKGENIVNIMDFVEDIMNEHFN